ncbi:MAG TPA: hypothetical protein VHA53_04390 [Nitrolancea sp.]|jgi:hypothetical protein|nr:hypothetical protein [Nitrolancea sp.]
MPEEERFDWRRTLGIGVPVLALVAGAYLRFGILETLREDEGFQHDIRRWTPVATEFRVRQIRLARSIIRSARFARRCHLLTAGMVQKVEEGALELVRCESRPVYPSGRRGEWGDTGARWQISDVA